MKVVLIKSDKSCPICGKAMKRILSVGEEVLYGENSEIISHSPPFGTKKRPKTWISELNSIHQTNFHVKDPENLGCSSTPQFLKDIYSNKTKEEKPLPWFTESVKLSTEERLNLHLMYCELSERINDDLSKDIVSRLSEEGTLPKEEDFEFVEIFNSPHYCSDCSLLQMHNKKK